MEKVPSAGYKIIGLRVVGIQRKLSFSNLLFPFKLMASLRKAKKIVENFHPDVVIGTGGYASGPALYAASKLKIPTLIQEQNSFAGITNKWLAKRVNRICVAYSGMEKFFPAEKIVLTGNPIRQDIHGTVNKKQEALTHFKLDATKKTLLVIGGSLGARTINLSIGNGLSDFTENGIQLIWQTGKNYIENAKAQCKSYESKGIHAFDFISRMDLAYAAADVVISRAGASSVSELCVAEKPCILVPSPNVAEDHQTKNANALTQVKAAILVRDDEASDSLVNAAIKLVNNTSQQDDLRKNIAKLAIHNSAEKIAEEIYQLLK
jgi:UDP-N-acetylglucosamine--N-acetylmuramyl-(pentapeptide) pyrophosphoryl-undecaprenol N-acetylglucosamine transferase